MLYTPSLLRWLSCLVAFIAFISRAAFHTLYAGIAVGASRHRAPAAVFFFSLVSTFYNYESTFYEIY